MKNNIPTFQLSHWERTVFFSESDVVIIGAGIVGVNAAIRLKELSPKLRIIILERGTLPLGASTRNAGFACFGSMTELLDDLKSQDENEVFTLVEKRWRGLQRLRERVGEQTMDYRAYGAYELFKKEEESDFQQCMDHLSRFNRILKKITLNETVFETGSDHLKTFGFNSVAHLIYNSAEGQLNPGLMMKALWEMARSTGVEIYTGIEVEDLESSEDHAIIHCKNKLKLKTEKVLLATNGFTRRLRPELKVQPARNQVLITKPIPNLKIKGCFHYDKGYFYFRNVGERILLGGGRHLAKEAEQTDEFGHTQLIQNALTKLLDEVILPNTDYEVDRWWSGILGVGSKKQPIIKKLNQNVYTAVRLGGMGVAIGTLVGEEAAELLVNT